MEPKPIVLPVAIQHLANVTPELAAILGLVVVELNVLSTKNVPRGWLAEVELVKILAQVPAHPRLNAVLYDIYLYVSAHEEPKATPKSIVNQVQYYYLPFFSSKCYKNKQKFCNPTLCFSVRDNVECETDAECGPGLACLQNSCRNPCDSTSCGQRAVCRVANTLPFRTMVCECPKPLTGDASVQCNPSKSKFCLNFKSLMQIFFYNNKRKSISVLIKLIMT